MIEPNVPARDWVAIIAMIMMIVNMLGAFLIANLIWKW